jgi:single-strand selective monofunctional uracil DNA glycosylase
MLSQELAEWIPAVQRDVPSVAVTYNPLEYARLPWQRYTESFGTAPARNLFLGMNPGPWGMAQTGIPFGEVAAVRDWMGIQEPVYTPATMHPKRPILGFDCQRSEVSGRRLWGLAATHYATAAAFFSENFVLNYCPLVFMEETGRNLTPDKLPQPYRGELQRLCDQALGDVIPVLQPRALIGIGLYARRALDRVAADVYVETPPPTIISILHPSPASPAANTGWSSHVLEQLRAANLWIR